MSDAIPLVLAALAIAAMGAAVTWAVLHNAGQANRVREQALAKSMVELSHDIRGALSPCLLMAERLESSADASVRQAGTIIAKAIDRASDIAKAGSELAKRHIVDN